MTIAKKMREKLPEAMKAKDAVRTNFLHTDRPVDSRHRRGSGR